MPRYTYLSIEDAPRDGTPVIVVCGGVECVACWHDPLPGVLEAGWYHWDEEELAPSHERLRGDVTEWRDLYRRRKS